MVLVSPAPHLIEEVKKLLAAEFRMKDNGPIKMFCGIEIDYNREQRTVSFSQHAYAKSLVEQVGDVAKRRARTPLVDTIPSTDIDKEVQPRFRMLVGKIMWLANHTRPDLAFTASALSRHLSSPSKIHLDAAERCVAYIAQTISRKLEYQPRVESGLVGYCDATWASDSGTQRKSTTGYCILIYGCLVSWKTQVQRVVAQSVVESELVAANAAATELLFFRNLLRELYLFPCPVLKSDSQGCVLVAKDSKMHWKLRHMDTRFQSLKHHVQLGDIKIEYVPGPQNPADIFTKAVGTTVLARHSKAIGLRSPSDSPLVATSLP